MSPEPSHSRKPRARARPSSERPQAPDPETADGSLTPIVGTNLRRLRVHRGLSLDRLAKSSGVSRAMLSQVELGRSTPTINLLWRIARALEVPFSTLLTANEPRGPRVLRRVEAKILASHNGSFTSRALFPHDAPRRVEFYELRLAPRSAEHADPHPPGTTENLVVYAGDVEIEVAGERTLLRPGDSILFQADVAHAYLNPTDSESVMFLVMTYADSVG